MSTMLQIGSLQKSYTQPSGESRRVVDIADFRLMESEQAALRGPSGCGKTTLLHLLAGFVTPDSGEIHVCGTRLDQLPERERDRFRAQHIGYVFQSCNLLQGCTVMENVLLGACFGKGANPAFARRLLRSLGLEDVPHCFPRQLSLGQQQRVAVARALSGRPRLVLADEPTANLDDENAFRTCVLLREICTETGAALLVVSHDERVLSGFERVLDYRELQAGGLVHA